MLKAATSFWAQIIVGGIALILLFAFLVSKRARIAKMGNQTKAISNCKQIITVMKLYSSDNSGSYPDWNNPPTSNAAFRRMFIDGQANNEMIFGCPSSPFTPNGNTGSAPDFTECLKLGENHWAMTRGLSDSSSGDDPLVYENPILADWPPKWTTLAEKKKKRSRGDSWGGGRIVVGLNDTSVSLLQLEPNFDAANKVARDKSGQEVFKSGVDSIHFPKGEVLDVEQAPAANLGQP